MRLGLGGQAPYSTPELFRRAPVVSEIEPLATYAARLERLSFVMRCALPTCLFVERVFASSHWLDLKSPTSTVREVTPVVSNISWPDDVVAEDVDKSLLVLEIRKFVKEEIIVGFEDEEPVEVRLAVWVGIGRVDDG